MSRKKWCSRYFVCHYYYSSCLLLHIGVVDLHVCILRKRFDPSSGMMRWSQPKKDLCFCQWAVAPKIALLSTDQSCPRNEDSNAMAELWFTDEPTSLTNHTNWTPKKLDALLNRTYCCKCLLNSRRSGYKTIFIFE